MSSGASRSAADQKNTLYVAGFGQDVDSQALYAQFVTFGEILDVQIPPPDQSARPQHNQRGAGPGAKHRGFGFITFSQHEDALDAIDNMHLNELNGRILKVNLAKSVKGQSANGSSRAIWENEEWIRQYTTSAGESLAADRQQANAQAGDGEQ